MKNNVWNIIALLAAIHVLPSLAYADIGEVGSPVVASNAVKQPSKKNAAKTKKTDDNVKSDTTPAAPDPLLVIDFSKRHVYFDREINAMLAKTEPGQIDATYEVVSQVPAPNGNKLQSEHLTQRYNNNVNDVVGTLEDLGIPPERIKVRTEESADTQSQQVSISTVP